MVDRMKKFLIIDGNSIINRAFYGIRPLSTKSGIPTNAIYGFLTIIKKHLDSLSPDYLACAFDVHEPTFRHKAFADYKGTRKGMPDELRAQMPYAKRAAEYLGFKVIECPGFEADDIIGTGARMAEENGIFTYILTGDRDSLQLVTKMTTVVLAKTKEDVEFTEERFESEYGIKPAQFVDVKALMGDSSDNIPGVAGIGEKTALKLIQTAGDLDTLYSSENYFGQSASVSKKLTDGRDSAYMSRSLALISREAPICPADELFTEREMNAEEFNSLCSELEFSGMAKKFGAESVVTAEYEPPVLNVSFVRELPSFEHEAVLYYDGSFAAVTEDGVNISMMSGAKIDAVSDFMQKNKIVCHDLKTLLRATGIPGDSVNCAYDTMLAAYLISPGKGRYELGALSFEYCGKEASSPAEKAAAIYKIWKDSEKTIDSDGMRSLMDEIEIPLSKVLTEMESTGFKIDADGIRAYAKELAAQENVLAESIWLQAGHEFNINSPKQLGEVLFDEIGLPSGKKTKTGYSTDADTLEALRPYHTIISDILTYRQTSKLRGTYGDTLANQADENGRIHTKLNQTGTATGRLASSDPNLQNIPVRGEMGRELRKYFVAEEGYTLIDADYSQIELRLLAVLSDDDAMKRAFIGGEDIHAEVASQVFGVALDDVTPEQRRRAKAVNFGIVYGIGEFSLAKDLGISRKMAKEYIENYLSTYSGVDKYLKETVEEAKKNGYTTTMFSRRRNIPELTSTNKNIRAFGERVAMNSPIQGSAADVIKIAMINVDRALKESGLDARLIMQVHDELIIEAKEECASEAAELLVREMENAVHLSVPLTADCGVGKSWYDAK